MLGLQLILAAGERESGRGVKGGPEFMAQRVTKILNHGCQVSERTLAPTRPELIPNREVVQETGISRLRVAILVEKKI